MGEIVLKSYQFRREREATWRELDALVSTVESKGMTSLSAQDLERLPLLYRATLSSLSVARSISLDRNVLDYLEALCARAYFCVYSTRKRPWDAVSEFFCWRFPTAVRHSGGYVLIATVFLLLGAATGAALTLSNQEHFYTFVSSNLAGGRDPASSTEALRQALYHVDGMARGLEIFAAFLFTHNAKIGILAFALGFALGLPVFFLMFTNGLMLGAFGALYHSRGLSLDFWGWVLPHGVTELLAVVLCGGAGLVLAHSLIFPGRHPRIVNLAQRGQMAGQIVLGAVCMFFVAALIEGFFRQLVTDIYARYFVVTTSAAFWIWYFGFVGRNHGRPP